MVKYGIERLHAGLLAASEPRYRGPRAYAVTETTQSEQLPKPAHGKAQTIPAAAGTGEDVGLAHLWVLAPPTKLWFPAISSDRATVCSSFGHCHAPSTREATETPFWRRSFASGSPVASMPAAA